MVKLRICAYPFLVWNMTSATKLLSKTSFVFFFSPYRTLSSLLCCQVLFPKPHSACWGHNKVDTITMAQCRLSLSISFFFGHFRRPIRNKCMGIWQENKHLSWGKKLICQRDGLCREAEVSSSSKLLCCHTQRTRLVLVLYVDLQMQNGLGPS